MKIITNTGTEFQWVKNTSGNNYVILEIEIVHMACLAQNYYGDKTLGRSPRKSLPGGSSLQLVHCQKAFPLATCKGHLMTAKCRMAALLMLPRHGILSLMLCCRGSAYLLQVIGGLQSIAVARATFLTQWIKQ